MDTTEPLGPPGTWQEAADAIREAVAALDRAFEVLEGYRPRQAARYESHSRDLFLKLARDAERGEMESLDEAWSVVADLRQIAAGGRVVAEREAGMAPEDIDW